MSRRNKIAPFLVVSGCILFFGYSFYIYSNLNSEIDDAISKNNKCQSHGKILKQQLKVVYHHTSKLEEALKKEKENHKNVKQEYASKVRDYEVNITKSKHEALNRFNALDTNYKMLKANHEELNEQHQMLQQTYVRLTEDHKKVAESAKRDYETLKSEKDTESFSLQARIQELFNAKVHYQEQAKANQDYLDKTMSQLKAAEKLAKEYMERIKYYEEHVGKLKEKLKSCNEKNNHETMTGLYRSKDEKWKFNAEDSNLSDMDDDRITPIKQENNLLKEVNNSEFLKQETANNNVMNPSAPSNERYAGIVNELDNQKAFEGATQSDVSRKTLHDLLNGNDVDVNKSVQHIYHTKELDTVDNKLERVFIPDDKNASEKVRDLGFQPKENDIQERLPDETVNKEKRSILPSFTVANENDDVIKATQRPSTRNSIVTAKNTSILEKVQNISSSLRHSSLRDKKQGNPENKLTWKEILKTTLEESAENVKNKPVEKPAQHNIFRPKDSILSTTAATTTESNLFRQVRNQIPDSSVEKTTMPPEASKTLPKNNDQKSNDNKGSMFEDERSNKEGNWDESNLSTTKLPLPQLNHMKQLKAPIAKLTNDEESYHAPQNNQLKPPVRSDAANKSEKQMSEAEIEAAEYNHDEQNVPEQSRDAPEEAKNEKDVPDDGKNERFYDSHVSENDNDSREDFDSIKQTIRGKQDESLLSVKQVDGEEAIENVDSTKKDKAGENDTPLDAKNPLKKPPVNDKDSNESEPTFDSHVSETDDNNEKDELGDSREVGNQAADDQPHILSPEILEEKKGSNIEETPVRKTEGRVKEVQHRVKKIKNLAKTVLNPVNDPGKKVLNPIKGVAVALSNFKSKIDSQQKIMNKLAHEDDENGDQNLDQNNQAIVGQKDADNDGGGDENDEDEQRGVDEIEHADN